MKNVLVVDDDPSVRTLMAMIVKFGKHNPIEAKDALEALETLARWEKNIPHSPIAALVTDIRMPEISGYELAKRVRAWIPELPILMVSGFSDALYSVPTDFFETQGIDFLAKPFTPVVFTDKLNSMLGQSASQLER